MDVSGGARVPADTPIGLYRWVLTTWTGRAVLSGAVALVAAARVSGTSARVLNWAGFVLIAVAAVALAIRLTHPIRQRLLWKVRRRLALSYLFLGIVPTGLAILFFGLCVLLFFVSTTGHMMRASVAGLVDEARAVAEVAAADAAHAQDLSELESALRRRRAALATRYPGVSLVAIARNGACAPRTAARASGGDTAVVVGPWTHERPPDLVPDWVSCQPTGVLLALPARPSADPRPRQLVARGLASTATAAHEWVVVADITIDPQVSARLRGESGVEIDEVVGLGAPGQAAPSEAEPERSPVVDSSSFWTRHFQWVSYVETSTWESGSEQTMAVRIRTSISDVYHRLVDTPRIGGIDFSQAILTLLAIVGTLFVLMVIVATGVGVGLARSITTAVHGLFAGTQRVQAGDFSGTVPVTSADQLGELARSFNAMTSSITHLMVEQREKDRLAHELDLARRIQISLLPQSPELPHGLRFAAHCEPAREVGGDYYDVVPIDDHTVGVLIADVAGKGTAAALFAAELKGIVMALGRQHRSPRALLIAANEILARHLDNGTFITASYLIFDLCRREVRYARAGHCPLLYRGRDQAAPGEVLPIAPNGTVLGLEVLAASGFADLMEESVMPLAPGDRFVLYTDGVSEATNGGDEFFGEARLANIIEQSSHESETDLVGSILDRVAAHAAGATQHDDLTVVVVDVAASLH